MHSRLLMLCACLCVLVLFMKAEVFAATATPVTNDNQPNGVYTGTAIAGTNTYAQINFVPTSSRNTSFSFTSGMLTLTGNAADGQMFTSPSSAYPQFTMQNATAPTTLVLQKGTFTGGINLWSRQAATLIIGSGAATPQNTVTITRPNIGGSTVALGGLPMAANMPGSSILETRGAHLVINGVVAGSGYIGQMRAWNGDITMAETRDSPSNQVGYLSVYGGGTITSNAPLVIVQNLDLWDGSRVLVNNSTIIQSLIHNQPDTINEQTYTGMKKGSLLHSTGNIVFRGKLQDPNLGLCGINGASGTMSTDQSIEGWNHTGAGSPRIDLLQGDGGELHLIAGQRIEARDIDAYETRAGQEIVARNLSGQILEATAGNIQVTEKITGGTATAGQDITADTISGNATAGRDVVATTSITGGAISAGRYIRTNTLSGTSMNAGQDIVAVTITGGAATAGQDMTADTISGSATAGRDVVATTSITGGAISAGRFIRTSTLSASSMNAGQDIVAVTITGGAATAGQDMTADSITLSSARIGHDIVAKNLTGSDIYAENEIRVEEKKSGNVSGGQNITAAEMEGSATAGKNITADSIKGDAKARQDITAPAIAGGVIDAGGTVTATSLSGTELRAGVDIVADNLSGGTVWAGRNVQGQTVKANSVEAGGNIQAASLTADKARAGVDIISDDINGETVSAGRNVQGKTINATSVEAGGNIQAASLTADKARAGVDIISDNLNGGTVSAGRNIRGGNIRVTSAQAGGSIQGASLTANTARAGVDIVADALRGGSAQAGRDIAVSGMNVTTATAGRNIVAGASPEAGQIAITASTGQLSPTKTITAGSLSAKLVAAGEIIQKEGTTGRIEAEQLLVAQNPGDSGSTGDVTLSSGTFALTGTDAIGPSGYDAIGKIISRSQASWIGGNLDVVNVGQSSFTTLGVGGLARIAGGTLKGDGLAADSAILHDGIMAELGSVSITDSAAGYLQIGAASDTDAQTSVSIGSFAAGGRDLRAGAGGGLASAAVKDFGPSGNLADGNIYVGHNGMLALGTDNVAWLPQMAARAAMPQNAAVFGVASPLRLGQGLFVDSAWSQPQGRARNRVAVNAGGVEFSPNSLFVMDGGLAGTYYADPAVPTRSLPADAPGAISADAPKTANVQGGAKIYIDHVSPGHTYVALGRNITTKYADATAWSGPNLLSSNPLLGLQRLGNGMEGQFGVVEKAPQIKHVAASSGVPRMARSVSEAMEDAIYHRIRLGQEDLYRRSFALWALPLYERINQYDLDGGNHSYGFTGGLGGIAIGGDYTWENTLRLGLAFNIGAGYAQSTGEIDGTKNNISFWGAGAYAVWKPGQFSLDADIDFTSTYNKLKQDLPEDMPAPEVKADVPAWALGLSLRAQYEFDTDWLIIRPHAGVRYFHLNTSPYDVTMQGQDVLRAHRAYQNVWTFPFGVVFTKEIRLESGFEILPLLNLKVIPASGDIYVKNSICYTDSIRDIDMETQVMDNITYGGRAGIEFRGESFSLGLNYTAQFGSHTANQGVFGVLRYEF